MKIELLLETLYSEYFRIMLKATALFLWGKKIESRQTIIKKNVRFISKKYLFFLLQ